MGKRGRKGQQKTPRVKKKAEVKEDMMKNKEEEQKLAEDQNVVADSSEGSHQIEPGYKDKSEHGQVVDSSSSSDEYSPPTVPVIVSVPNKRRTSEDSTLKEQDPGRTDQSRKTDWDPEARRFIPEVMTKPPAAPENFLEKCTNPHPDPTGIALEVLTDSESSSQSSSNYEDAVSELSSNSDSDDSNVNTLHSVSVGTAQDSAAALTVGSGEFPPEKTNEKLELPAASRSSTQLPSNSQTSVLKQSANQQESVPELLAELRPIQVRTSSSRRRLPAFTGFLPDQVS